MQSTHIKAPQWLYPEVNHRSSYGNRHPYPPAFFEPSYPAPLSPPPHLPGGRLLIHCSFVKTPPILLSSPRDTPAWKVINESIPRKEILCHPVRWARKEAYEMGTGDWGIGTGEWRLGIGDWRPGTGELERGIGKCFRRQGKGPAHNSHSSTGASVV